MHHSRRLGEHMGKQCNEEDQLGVVGVTTAYLPVLVQALDINAID